MASGVYNEAKGEWMKGSIDLVNDTDVYCALMDNVHTFDTDLNGWAAVSANEISGTGYTTKGVALASKAVTIDDTDDEGVFDANDAQWTTATFTAYHAVVWDDAVVTPTDPLICSIDFGGAQAVTAGTFTIQWATEGIVNIN